MVDFMINNTQLFLTIFFGILGFFVVLALLAHLRTLALIKSGLYRSDERRWFDGHHFADGLMMLAIGGGIFAGIYFHFGFWATCFLSLGALGVAAVVGSFVRR